MRLTDGHVLGEDAAGVVRQAVSLAARRGHARVTPLHITSAMLSAPAPAGILRAACIRSHSRPMQHSALDRCLDLALDRLAVSVARHGGDPAPSNALVAALKRAQAHRRGRGEGMVELEKLVVSVLDDPGVDRVMRAAGFSSSQVRASIVASPKISTRAPNPVPDMIRAGGGQPPSSLQTVPNGSAWQASNAKSVEVRPIIPPPLRRYKDTTCTRSTYCGTNLQKNASCRRPKFTELTATNLKRLCNALELHVPRHRNIVPGLSSTVLRCRSGVMGSRPSSSSSLTTTTTCLLFLGRDGGGKMAVARELARLVFGSYAEFTALQVQQGNPERTGKLALKRPRSPENNGGLEARLFGAIMENPHRVILIDGVDRLDRGSEMQINNAIAGESMMEGCNGDVVCLEDAIIVLSASDLLDSRYVVPASSPRVKRRFCTHKVDAVGMEGRSHRSWDLNVCPLDDEEEEEDNNMTYNEGIMKVVDGVFLFN